VTVVSVQNLYNLGNRQSEAVLDYCTRHELGFIPWFPLAAGDMARPAASWTRRPNSTASRSPSSPSPGSCRNRP